MPAPSLWQMAPDRPAEGDFLPHHALEPKAIVMACMVIGSWADYEITADNDIPDHMMPTPALEEIAGFIRELISQGVTGRANLTEMAAARDPGHGELMRRVLDCFEESTAMLYRPSAMANYANKVRGHWLCKQQGYLTASIQECLKSGADPSPLIHQLTTLTDTSLENAYAGEERDYVRADEITEVVEVGDFVQGLLTEDATSLIYGPSNSGKSYWILDLAAHIATGRPWRNGEVAVDQGAVVYVALEGQKGIDNRINALRERGKLAPGTPLFVYRAPLSLIDSGDIQRLARNISRIIKDSAMPVKLVILDTLARAMAGGDENSGQDMSQAIATIDAIRRRHRTHLAIIHHPGKDHTKGARGHSSLRAAVDTEIEVTRSLKTGISTARVTKQRDLPARPPMPFALDSVHLGLDKRDEPITSCVVRHESSSMAPQPPKQGKTPKYDPEKLLQLLPKTSLAAWRDAVSEKLGMSQSQFYNIKSSLDEAGLIHLDPANGHIQRAESSDIPISSDKTLIGILES